MVSLWSFASTVSNRWGRNHSNTNVGVFQWRRGSTIGWPFRHLRRIAIIYRHHLSDCSQWRPKNGRNWKRPRFKRIHRPCHQQQQELKCFHLHLLSIVIVKNVFLFLLEERQGHHLAATVRVRSSEVEPTPRHRPLSPIPRQRRRIAAAAAVQTNRDVFLTCFFLLSQGSKKKKKASNYCNTQHKTSFFPFPCVSHSYDTPTFLADLLSSPFNNNNNNSNNSLSFAL